METQTTLIHDKRWSHVSLTSLQQTNFNVHTMKNAGKMVRFIGGLCLISIICITYLSYLCLHSSCSAPQHLRLPQFPFYHSPKQLVIPTINSSEAGSLIETVSFDQLITNDSFDIMGRDVMVFLHIQKTGGTTFGRHLVKNLNLDNPCVCLRKRKRCDCYRPNTINEQWLFSRYSTGWRCGLHADWTELTNCVENSLDEIEGMQKKRRYFFITVLRDPVYRYISEFRHVQRGATWKAAGHWCGGQEFDFPKCYQDQDWSGVELEEFMNCSYNFAHNRQTRMLADLSLVGCYNSSSMKDPKERDRIMLASAKANLARMAYFGLTDEQLLSQYIFEETFKIKFVDSFEQMHSSISSQTIAELSVERLKLIKQLNHLDMELYEFGHQLLFERFNRLKRREPRLLNDTDSQTNST